MKCVIKDTKEYEYFCLTKNNIKKFIKWLNKISEFKYKYIYYNKDENLIELEYENNIYNFEINRYYVYKNGTLFDYDKEIFYKLYKII